MSNVVCLMWWLPRASVAESGRSQERWTMAESVGGRGEGWWTRWSLVSKSWRWPHGICPIHPLQNGLKNVT